MSAAPVAPTTPSADRPVELPANLAVIRGRVSRPPARRQLPSGSDIVQLEVAAADAAGSAVPVVVRDPAFELAEGDDIIVVGSVVRRFFRAGGVTQSRTEVVASAVIRATGRRSVERAVWQAIARAARTG